MRFLRSMCYLGLVHERHSYNNTNVTLRVLNFRSKNLVRVVLGLWRKHETQYFELPAQEL